MVHKMSVTCAGECLQKQDNSKGAESSFGGWSNLHVKHPGVEKLYHLSKSWKLFVAYVAVEMPEIPVHFKHHRCC